MKKTILCLVFCSLICNSAFADVDVVDESHNFAFGERSASVDDGSVFVLSENSEQPRIKADGLKQASEPQTMQILLSKVEAMQLEIAQLRGMVEQQKHQLELAGVIKSQTELKNTELKEALEIKKGTSPLLPLDATQNDEADKSQSPDGLVQSQDDAVKAKPVKASASDPMDEQFSYVEAYEHVKHKRYQKAIPAMKTFIQNYPGGPYVANAHYWLGELYGVQGDYAQAIEEFKLVLTEYSDSMKVSSAQYKLGVMYENLGKKELAQSEFVKVTEAFPGTAVARLAQAKLKQY